MVIILTKKSSVEIAFGESHLFHEVERRQAISGFWHLESCKDTLTNIDLQDNVTFDGIADYRLKYMLNVESRINQPGDWESDECITNRENI